jgi:hypothetical protein
MSSSPNDDLDKSSHISDHIANPIPAYLGQDAELITAQGHIITKDGVVVLAKDSEKDPFTRNIFSDPEIVAYYRAVYEKAKYECRHIFDPQFTWESDEEKRLIRKLDWHGKQRSTFAAIHYQHIHTVCLWACVMFFGLQVDRGNLVQAVSGTLLQDLNLSTNGTFYAFNFYKAKAHLISQITTMGI